MSARRTVDMRSDTVTRPTAAMREAMMAAPLGDDVFRDDPTVLALEEEVAARLGAEAGLYVASGTLANQLALRVHTRHGDAIIAHAGCHIANYESGAPAALAGVMVRGIASPDGSLPGLADAICQIDDPHFSQTALICLENTHNGCGGVVLDAGHVASVVALARERGIALHLDGARLFNAAVASAAARYALTHHVERLAEDHRRARALAEGLAALPGIAVDLDRVQTNLVYFELDPAHPLGGPGLVAALAERGVYITGGAHRLRACTHLDVGDEDIGYALRAFRALL